MVWGRQRAEWERTADLIALFANCNRDKKRRRTPFTGSEFNPYRDPPKQPTAEQIAARQAAKEALAESLITSTRKN